MHSYMTSMSHRACEKRSDGSYLMTSYFLKGFWKLVEPFYEKKLKNLKPAPRDTLQS